MATLAAICLGLLTFSAIEQLVAVLVFLHYCRKPAQKSLTVEPSVLVVLPVRGADETLADCVSALVEQKYSNFRVRIVFDSHTDPGWRIVDSILTSHPDAAIELLQLGNPRSTCSLKCSAVYEATEDLDDVEVVAFVDSDVVPHATWLQELVAPFADPSVGVTHGNRWYLPHSSSWGSLVRYCWNAVAVVTMHLWQMPWGGTIAMRRRVLDETDIRQRWLRAGCEDVPLGAAVRRLKLKARFVPSLILKDRESVPLSRCLPFLDRQLLWARLYHPACWWTSNVWQVVVASATLVSLVVALVGLATLRFDVLGMAVLALTFHNGFALCLLNLVERQLISSERGPASQHPLKCLMSIAATQVLMVRVILVSLLTRTIHWRGIEYRIAGPWKIEMVEYHPYGADTPIESLPDLVTAAASASPDRQPASL